jgi:hypothetical protein
MAAGLLVADQQKGWDVRLRATFDDGPALFKLDRWD